MNTMQHGQQDRRALAQRPKLSYIKGTVRVLCIKRGDPPPLSYGREWVLDWTGRAFSSVLKNRKPEVAPESIGKDISGL